GAPMHGSSGGRCCSCMWGRSRSLSAGCCARARRATPTGAPATGCRSIPARWTMLELLSLIFGGVLRLAPEVLVFFKAKNDQAHEHRMTLLQLDIDKARAQQALDLAHAQHAQAMDKADMDALVAALQAQAAPSGVRWIDALSSSVRPVLTYWHAVV